MNNVLEIRNIRRFLAFARKLDGTNDYYFEAEFRDGTIGIVRFPVYLRLRSVSVCSKAMQVMSEVARAKEELVAWDYYKDKFGVSKNREEFVCVID